MLTTDKILITMKIFKVLIILFFLTPILMAQNYLVLDLADITGPVISKHIYGHFSEHLGICIYEGYWVGGDDSGIESVNGIRQGDVLKVTIPARSVVALELK